jgi:hypothetical protein
MTGIVETDWLPYTFTMNWKFQRGNIPVTFEKGKPVCTIFPIRRGSLEEIEPCYENISDNRPLKELYEEWASSRKSFNADLRIEGSDALRTKWQRHYFTGKAFDGKTFADYRTKLRLREFK